MTTESRLETVETDLDNVKQTLIQVADILHNTADRQRENSVAIDRLGQRLDQVAALTQENSAAIDRLEQRLDRFAAISEEREQQAWSVLNVLIEDTVNHQDEIRALREENRKILEYLLGRDTNGNA